ncbi:MAG TPA: type II secretion system F family protein [Beijerinckiaceae bacterium]|jgi:tight adherence protein B
MISTQVAVGALVALAAGGVAYVFVYPLISGDARAEKRQQALIGAKADRRGAMTSVNRREQVAQSLKDLETKQRSKDKLTLEGRIAQAGLTWTKTKFFLFSALLGIAFGLTLLVLNGNPLVAAAGLFAGGVGLPRWILSFLKNRRINRFLEELPNAMDVIVRGIRSGLPLNDCIRIVAAEAREPVRSEFRQIVEGQALGISIPESVAKLYERVPVPESNFFAIVLGIQAKSGGNLSEALGNLSKVLRERKKMKGKVKAMSMEAKSSAGIIASLPFIVGLLTYISSPAYIEILWQHPTGQFVMVISACWMAMGVFVMKRMINFEI